MNIRGNIVRKVLVTNAAEIAREIYLGAILDRETHSIVIMASAEGGVEIEVVARDTPEKIIRRSVDPYLGFGDFQGREIGFALGLNPAQVRQFTKIAAALYKTLMENDATLLEINPLAVTDDGNLYALDAKMVVNDNALFRHPKIETLRDMEAEDPSSSKPAKKELVTSSSTERLAALSMAPVWRWRRWTSSSSMAEVRQTFWTSAAVRGPSEFALALRLVLSDPKVQGVFFNIFGGITRCDEVARGIVEAIRQIGGAKVPIVVRLVGVNEAEGRQILQEAGLNAYTSLDDAARAAVTSAQSTLPSGAPAASREVQRERARRPRHAAPRARHDRAGGRVPHPSDARIRHQRRGGCNPRAWRPEPGESPGLQYGRRGGGADRGKRLDHLRARALRSRRDPRSGRKSVAAGRGDHRRHPGSGHGGTLSLCPGTRAPG